MSMIDEYLNTQTQSALLCPLLLEITIIAVFIMEIITIIIMEGNICQQ